ncbi:40S ribosomal protein S7 [Amylostereum chailletii]|nr:40S ribosomal protein S7 [Amylostereum chailletii]
MEAPAPLPQPPAVDDDLSYLQSHPLFMTSLPDDDSENATLTALQSLVYDGTPDEIAQNFKEQGNDYFKGRRYREALGFYTQGVDAKPDDLSLKEALLCNRAACNLELKNYGSVLRDCSSAILLNAKCAKAYYRSGLALLALDRVDEAIDCCDRCLAFDQGNAGVKTLQERAVKKKVEQERKEMQKQERLQREAEARRRLKAAFAVQGSANPYQPHLDPDDPTQNTFIFPVFFIYPQHAISDAIPQFVETTTFGAQMETMFPPAAPAPGWDAAGEYVDGRLVAYAMTRRKRLLKIGRKMTLRQVCAAAGAKAGEPRDGLEMKDGCLTFVVLPKGQAEQKWVDEFKKGRGLQEHPPKYTMSVQNKIFRTANAPTTPPDETETGVAQAILDLESSAPELKAELRPLQISAAREVDVRGGKKAIVVFVPVPQLKAFHKVQQRLTRELEKKFSDRHVVFVAQRRMLRKPTRTSRVKQKRPRSRTLTNVHEKILEDLVFPTEIVGKRTRVNQDGSKLLKVFLDSKDSTSLEYKLDSFSSVYRRLTGKDVVFEFPVQAAQD